MKSKARKPPVKVPYWAYTTWKEITNEVLVTYKTDGKKLAALIQEHSELALIVAWLEYATAGVPLYHFEPVTVVHKWTNPKNGREHVDSIPDESTVTTFALALFLAHADGYIIEAEQIIAQPDWQKRFHAVRYLPPFAR